MGATTQGTSASHGSMGTNTAEMLRTHDLDGTVNANDENDGHRGCSGRPFSGLQGTENSEFRPKHKPDGTVKRSRQGIGPPRFQQNLTVSRV